MPTRRSCEPCSAGSKLGAVRVSRRWSLVACAGPLRCRPKPEAAAENFEAAGPGASRPAGYGHMDDAPAAHRLRPWTTCRCAAALPTAATFDHMPTAFDHGCVETGMPTALQGDSCDQGGWHKENSCLVARQICSKVEQHRRPSTQSNDKHSRVTFLREATRGSRPSAFPTNSARPLMLSRKSIGSRCR